MSRTFFFDFEELPVTVDGGFELGSMEGRADISYTRDGEWAIDGIQLLGYKKAGPRYDKKMIWLDAGTPLFLMLHDVLENRRHDEVQEAVREQLDIDREEAAEYRADARRDDMRMGL
jgi:hypothetical protein